MSEDLANAEEWARWAAVHDDWDRTQALMGVLLAEYDRRGAELERHISGESYRTVVGQRNEWIAKALGLRAALSRRYGCDPDVSETVPLPPPPGINHWISAYFDYDDEDGEASIRWEPLNEEPFNWRCVHGIRLGATEDWAEIVCAAIRYEWVLRHGT